MSALNQKDAFVRPATAKDATQILALINTVQPHATWTKERFVWQFEQGPSGPALVRVMECEGRIAALYVATRKTITVRERSLQAFMVQDVMTEPQFRGRGFLNTLAASVRAEIHASDGAAFTFPNKLSENSFRRNGWTELSRVPFCAARVDGAALHDVELVPVEMFKPTVLDIWNASGLRIGVTRSADFLNWRYAAPGVTYRRFMIAGTRGFVVLKVYDRGDARVVHVCDLVLRNDALADLGGVVASIHALAREQGASELQAWLVAGHPYFEAFSEAGFVRDEAFDRFVFVDGPATVLPELSNATAWHLMQGDSDVY